MKEKFVNNKLLVSKMLTKTNVTCSFLTLPFLSSVSCNCICKGENSSISNPFIPNFDEALPPNVTVR